MNEPLAMVVVNEGEQKLADPLNGGLPKVNPALAYLASLHSETSVKTMRSKLKVFAQWAGYSDVDTCPWDALRPDVVVAFVAYLDHSGHSPATNNAYLAALKSVAKMGWVSEVISHETYLRIKAIKGQKSHRLPSGRSLSYEESGALLESCDVNDIKGCRDKLIFSLMLGCGLRRAEICTLRFEKYDPQERSFRVIGKGDKERIVFLPEPVVSVLQYWIENYRGDMDGLLFGRIYKNQRLSLSQPMDPTTIGRIVQQRMESANQRSATAHDLRRSFATRLLEKKVDLVTVKNMMGHANIATTAMYDRRGEEAMQEATKDIKL